jgi:surface protein
MGIMFSEATSFNQDIGNWNTSNVINMNGMFYKATAFNQNIGNWNTSNVMSMDYMFCYATSFNQDISNWNTSEVIYMYDMFNKATSFNQNIGKWDIKNVIKMDNMFSGITISTLNYDALLNSWNSQNVKNGLAFDGGNSKYSSASASARQNLITKYGWTITDGGQAN